MTAGGPEAPLGPRRVGKLRHLLEAHLLDLLDDQLGNPVEALEPHALVRVEIHHDHLDLPTVPGINRPRGIHQGDAAAGGEAGSRVHEGRVPLGERDRHPGGQYGPFTGLQLARPRWCADRLPRRRDARTPEAVRPGRRAGSARRAADGRAHGFTSKARARRTWSGSSMAARISSGRPLSMKWSTLTSMKRASARTATGRRGRRSVRWRSSRSSVRRRRSPRPPGAARCRRARAARSRSPAVRSRR